MTSIECNLCELLLQQNFGSLVSKIGVYLAKKGKQTIPEIVKETKISLAHVKKSLCVLLQHNVVECCIIRNRFVQYRLLVPKVINWIFYPNVIYTVKSLYGVIAEYIIEQFLKNGMMTMSTNIKVVLDIYNKTAEKLCIEKTTVKSIMKVFEELIKTHFLIRKPMVKPVEEGMDIPILPEFLPNDKTMFEIPLFSSDDIAGLANSEESTNEPNAKRRKVEPGLFLPVDDGILWVVNIPRFHRYFRDQLIISSITMKFGSMYGEIVRTIVRISEVTTSPYDTVTQPLSSTEIHRSIQESYNLTSMEVSQCLKLLNADSDGMVGNSDDCNENLYSVDYKKSITQLIISDILSYIQEKFGKKSCRIFRLLMVKKHLEQKQIEDIAMIPSKEAKELLYAMLEDNMLVLQEVPKTADHAPSRTYFLFAVNYAKIVRTLLQRVYCGMCNLIIRWEQEIELNKRLIEKREKIDTIKANLQDGDEEQLQEIEEMITESEKAQLEKSNVARKKLEISQLQICDTILLFNFFLNLNTQN